jgi:hypothetical protein
MSVLPPGVNGTTRRTLLLLPWASADQDAAAANAPSIKDLRLA